MSGSAAPPSSGSAVPPSTGSSSPPSGGAGSPPSGGIPSPSSHREFEAFKPYSEATLDRVWGGGLIVPDANVLLHLYRVDANLRGALFDILEDKKVASRLWFPHQVLVEFFANRANVIAGQLRALEHLAKRVAETLGGLPETKETPRFLIDRDALRAMLADAQQKVEHFLADARASYPASISRDEILERLEPTIASRSGMRPADRARLVEEGERRVKERIPPGFKDADSSENGDYLVWAQCLEKCQRDKRDLLLVTDDKKDDWWYRVHGYTIGPRPELRAEFYAHVPTADFVLADFETFFERIAKYLTAELPPDTVDDAREFAHSLHHRLDADADQDMPDWDAESDKAVAHYREIAPTSDADARRSVNAMVSWFMERYEDPANGVPYDGREGGYQYVMGGPYNAEEELREVFEDGSKRMERIIGAAVKRIENDGFEWVKRGEY